MFQVEVIAPNGARRIISIEDEGLIGKATHNIIHLDSWRLAKEHARLFRTPTGIFVEDLGAFLGVNVNGQRIEHYHGPLQPTDSIQVGTFQLRLLEGTLAESKTSPSILKDQPPQDKPGNANPEPTSRVLQTTSPRDTPSIPQATSTPIAEHRLLEFEWRQHLHQQLLETMDLHRHDIHGLSDAELKIQTEALINEILLKRDSDIPSELDRALLGKQVLDEAIGLGPLEELLEDESISEIMVNRFDEIYIERRGRLEKHPLTFTADRAVMGVIERIVAPLGRRIDESSPMVDARLKDGSRVNAIIPPLALKGACLTIRKFSKRKLEAEDLIQFDSLSADMAAFLKIAVTSRKNIIVSGGTGSGKTTLLNILSNFIPAHERIITVEDAAELKLHHEHLVSLESRPANVEGKGVISIRELVKNTLRMRPDRIVVGECRGAEALDMLQAMNTGHEGSLTTLHANSPRDALARLETMILMAGMELPLQAIREQIASAVDILIQQTRFACGRRAITHIVEITGIESGTIQMQELFRFVHRGYQAEYQDGPPRTQGFFTACDVIPHFYEDLIAMQCPIDRGLFKPLYPDPTDREQHG